MFSSTKAVHISHIVTTALLGQVVSSGLTPPDPSKIENYGHLIIQALVALVTIWATVHKALQKPEEVVRVPVEVVPVEVVPVEVVPVERVSSQSDKSNGTGLE